MAPADGKNKANRVQKAVAGKQEFISLSASGGGPG
jgi:hypothetical protein